jgi:hypothetical protein
MIILNKIYKEIAIYEKKINNFDKEKFMELITEIEREINSIGQYVTKRHKNNLIKLGFSFVSCYHHNDFLREEMKIKSKEIKFEDYDGLVMRYGLAEKGFNYNWLEINFDEIARRCIRNDG